MVEKKGKYWMVCNNFECKRFKKKKDAIKWEQNSIQIEKCVDLDEKIQQNQDNIDDSMNNIDMIKRKMLDKGVTGKKVEEMIVEYFEFDKNKRKKSENESVFESLNCKEKIDL